MRVLRAFVADIAGALCTAGAAWPQATSTGAGPAYPARPVRVIVPFPTGGANDRVATHHPAQGHGTGGPAVLD